MAKYPQENQYWYNNNNSIIIVTCSNYKEFKKILAKTTLQYVTFEEPDIAYQITAACFIPAHGVKELLKHCQLLGGPPVPPEEPKSLLDYVYLMRHTPQGTISVWEHGKQVEEKFLQLLNGNYKEWPRIASVPWLEQAIASFDISLLKKVSTYCLFHDIGKTLCYEQGHFPQHAQLSYETWLKVDGDETIAQWMRDDLAIHTMTQEEFSSISDKLIHALVGIAEVYANAHAFGGFESSSFKMKLKKVIRNGKSIF